MRKAHHFWLTICLLAVIGQVKAQEKRHIESFSPKQAVFMLRHSFYSDLREKALKELKQEAERGNAEALHYMGMIYAKGIEVQQDYEQAISYFEKAMEKGYDKSCYNLGMLYKHGFGNTEQDFAKAYRYFDQLAQKGVIPGVGMKGMMLYKGLGVKQDYKAAMQCFKTAAESGNGRGMYMYGLCFRNGYGTERNLSEASYWLTKASEKKIKASDVEMKTLQPENPITARVLRAPTLMPKRQTAGLEPATEHLLRQTDDISGEYTGVLVTYDWSGEHTLKETPLHLTIAQEGANLNMIWKEKDLDAMDVHGLVGDSAVVFERGAFHVKDSLEWYAGSVTWELRNAKLQVATEGKDICLYGSVQTYYPWHREPGRPMSVALRKTGESSDTSVEMDIVAPRIYPNPFTDRLNISFQMDEPDVCSFEVIAMDGTVVYQEKLGQLEQGMQYFCVDLPLPTGSYTAKLHYGTNTYSTIILKN